MSWVVTFSEFHFLVSCVSKCYCFYHSLRFICLAFVSSLGLCAVINFVLLCCCTVLCYICILLPASTSGLCRRKIFNLISDILFCVSASRMRYLLCYFINNLNYLFFFRTELYFKCLLSKLLFQHIFIVAVRCWILQYQEIFVKSCREKYHQLSKQFPYFITNWYQSTLLKSNETSKRK